MATEVVEKLVAATGLSSARVYDLPILVVRLPYAAGKGKGRVKIDLDGEHLTVEKAVTRLLQADGYAVFKGDDIHLVGHVLTGKFMGWKDDPTTFLNWGASHGSDPEELRQLIRTAREVFTAYSTGRRDVLGRLLATLGDRWDAYYAPVESKRAACRVFSSFLETRPELAARWIAWYARQAYDPRGAPDLFAVHEGSGHWCWIEVKSLRDNLHPVQWAWIEGFASEVSPSVVLFRLLPEE